MHAYKQTFAMTITTTHKLRRQTLLMTKYKFYDVTVTCDVITLRQRLRSLNVIFRVTDISFIRGRRYFENEHNSVGT